MSLTEQIIVTDGERVIETRERKLYSIIELRDRIDDEIHTSAFDRALQWVSEGVVEWDWWQPTLDDGVDDIKDKWGITYDPKNVTFDLDRGAFLHFGKTTEIDERTFLRKAGIDLRTKAAREIIGTDRWSGRLVIGGYHEWIGYPEYDCLPNYVEDMQPGITEKINDALNNAQSELLNTLRKEFEYITGEDNLVEIAEANEYTFDTTGHRA